MTAGLAGDAIQVLDETGQVVDGAVVPELADETFRSMYRHMRIARRFDERAVNLQRQGRLGTFPPAAGQEAAQVGCAYALDDDDPVVYQYREHAIPIVRGLPLAEVFRYWMGHETGNAAMADVAVFPLNIAIGSQIPHATGAAWAAKRHGNDRVVCCHFGDGATSEGDFHEGLNFAGVFDLPAIYVCNNNQWAISVPRDRQTTSETIAQKAQAYGFDGVQVDGMDPLAVYRVMKAAIEKARHPTADQRRPTLIEAVQYRFGAHTTADDPSAYRTEDEVDAWRERDPIPRFEAFLRETGRLGDETIAAIETDVEAIVADAVETAEAAHREDPAVMFDHVFADPTPELDRQRAYFNQLRERHGDDALLDE